MTEIGVEDLEQALAGGAILLDVREPQELRQFVLSYQHHIPMGQLQARIGELDPNADLIVYCHSGQRSAFATDFLRANGFARVRNLKGGIMAYQMKGRRGITL